jgi:hypothetical protein
VQATAPLETSNPADSSTSTLQESTANPAGIDTPTLQLPAPESDLESEVEVEAESDAATASARTCDIATCDECGEPRKVAEWQDGQWLCDECGRARFSAAAFGEIGRAL